MKKLLLLLTSYTLSTAPEEPKTELDSVLAILPSQLASNLHAEDLDNMISAARLPSVVMKGPVQELKVKFTQDRQELVEYIAQVLPIPVSRGSLMVPLPPLEDEVLCDLQTKIGSFAEKHGALLRAKCVTKEARVLLNKDTLDLSFLNESEPQVYYQTEIDWCMLKLGRTFLTLSQDKKWLTTIEFSTDNSNQDDCRPHWYFFASDRAPFRDIYLTRARVLHFVIESNPFNLALVYLIPYIADLIPRVRGSYVSHLLDLLRPCYSNKLLLAHNRIEAFLIKGTPLEDLKKQFESA